MKKVIVIALLTASAGVSYADGSSLYFGAGYGLVQQMRASEIVPALSKSNLDNEKKKQASGTIGYDFAQFSDDGIFALQVSYYKRPDVKEKSPSQTLMSDGSSIAALALIKYNINDVTLSAGAGISYNHFKSPAGFTVKYDKKDYTVKANESVKEFSPQVIAGVGYNITDKTTVGLAAAYDFPYRKVPEAMGVQLGFNTYL